MKNLLLLLLSILPFLQISAQQVISSQTFESGQPDDSRQMKYKITGSGGVAQAYTGMSPSSYLSSSSPFYSEGSTGYGVCGTQRVIDFDPVNVSAYTNTKLTFNLAAFGNESGAGLDLADSVTVLMSTNNVTYYEQIKIKGKNQSYWNHSETGSATAVYNTTNTPTTYSPEGTGDSNADGLGKVQVTGLPSTTTLYVRIVIYSSFSNETWVIDNVRLEGLQAPLPVEMTRFSVRNLGNKHLLDWTTAYEENVDGFIIERGKTANEFEQISTLKAMGAGGYSYTDDAPSGVSYYRIKTMDKDGSFNYSPIQSAVNNNTKWRIYPTVAESYITLEKEVSTDDISIDIFDITGRLILSQTVKAEESNFKIDVSNLSKGLYFIKIANHTEKFMKL